MPKKTLYVKESDLPVWEEAEKILEEGSMSTLVTEALREKLNSRAGYDYVVRMLNESEVGISASSARAQMRSRLQAGYTIAFKSRSEAGEYISVAEAEGFTFKGREVFSTPNAMIQIENVAGNYVVKYLLGMRVRLEAMTVATELELSELLDREGVPAGLIASALEDLADRPRTIVLFEKKS